MVWITWSLKCLCFQSKRFLSYKEFSNTLSHELGFKVRRISWWVKIKKCKKCLDILGLEAPLTSRPVFCCWALSGSDCSKRALCFSGLNHSGLIKKGLEAQIQTALAEQTDKWKSGSCLCLCSPPHCCLSHSNILGQNMTF